MREQGDNTNGPRILRSTVRFKVEEFRLENKARTADVDEPAIPLTPQPQADDPAILLQVRAKGGIAKIGEYYVYVDIYGQSMRLQIDTGSSSLIVAGDGCQNCTSRSFLRWKREELVPCDGKVCYQCYTDTSSCGFKLKYGDDTPMYNLEASGVVLQTSVAFRGRTPAAGKPFIYVIQKETGTWPHKVDGILGLAFDRLNCNPNCLPAPWRVLAPPGTQGFSICLGDREGKLMFYGKGLKRAPLTGRVKLPIIGDPKMYYAVRSRGLAILDDSDSNHVLLFDFIPVEDMRTRMFGILDSGTTLLIVPESTWQSMVTYFQTNYCHLPGVCDTETIFDRPSETETVCLTSSPHETFPTLSLVFGETALRLPPSLYFIRYKDGIYCLAIQPGPVLIVGDAVLRGFTVQHEDDAVIITDYRDADCGTIDGFTDGSQGLISTKNIRIGYVHHEVPVYSTMKRLASLTILLFVLYFVVHAWRRYMRRRLYNDI